MVTARRYSARASWREAVRLAGLVLVVSAVWGCAGPRLEKRETIFFPAPPDPPRIQYLTSFHSAKDVGDAPTDFLAFLVGEAAEKEKGIVKPSGVASHKGVIYVADIRQEAVLTLDLEHGKFDALRATGLGALREPVSIFIEPDGTKYVTDVERRQVVVFGPDDRFKMALGDGKEMKPTDAVVSGERVYVCDIENHQIRVYDKKAGKLLFTFGAFGRGEGEFNKPTHLTVDTQGNLYVSDLINFRIQRFDRDGKFLSTFGVTGTAPGNFTRPKGVAVDREGHIYVVDAGFENIQIFNQEGQLLMFFGGAGNAAGHMYLPMEVAVDYGLVPYFQRYVDPGFEIEYILLVTNQFGDYPVSVYGFGHLKESAKGGTAK